MTYLVEKWTDKTLMESELKYRKLFQKVLTGIYNINFRNYRITEINDLACKNIGYTRQEIFDMANPPDLLDEPSKLKFLE